MRLPYGCSLSLDGLPLSFMTKGGTTLSGNSAIGGRKSVWILGTLILSILGFYFWTAQAPTKAYAFGKDDHSYYALLAKAFLAGQLSLPVEVPPELAAAKNPYEPAERTYPVLHNASFYKGKYYIYFGPAPALVLFLPFRALTGWDLPQNMSVAILCSVGFLATA